MDERMYVTVYTQDLSSGKVHARLQETFAGRTRMLVDERCNLDQAGKYARIKETEIDSLDVTDVEPEQLCHFCFPAGLHGA